MLLTGLLYGPHYTPGVGQAVLGSLEIDSGSFDDLPVRDLSSGALDVVAISGQGPQIEDLRPRAMFRAADLAGQGLAVGDLTGGVLSMNGRTWRIESATVRGAPEGEADGEVECYLAEMT